MLTHVDVGFSFSKCNGTWSARASRSVALEMSILRMHAVDAREGHIGTAALILENSFFVLQKKNLNLELFPDSHKVMLCV